jgi:hypothetical protein
MSILGSLFREAHEQFSSLEGIIWIDRCACGGRLVPYCLECEIPLFQGRCNDPSHGAAQFSDEPLCEIDFTHEDRKHDYKDGFLYICPECGLLEARRY